MKSASAFFGDKLLKSAALIVIAIVAMRIAREFGAGFVDGFIAEITNGV